MLRPDWTFYHDIHITTYRLPFYMTIYLFIYLGFYVAFKTVQVISRLVVGRAEETSTYSLLGFCTVNCRPTASNYQLSHLRPCRESNPGLRGGRLECYHSATVAPLYDNKNTEGKFTTFLKHVRFKCWTYIQFNINFIVLCESHLLVFFLYCVFILSAISLYTTGLKALFNQSDCIDTAPTHK